MERIVVTARAQEEAFKRHDESAFARLDKELELLVGDKERAIGAFREHRTRHS